MNHAPAAPPLNARDEAIVVRELTKRYGQRLAVDRLSFSARRGEILALLGPNGAGKTTTIEILEGYRRADGGLARVLGLDPGRDAPALRQRVGVMLQEGGVYAQCRPLEMLRLVASFYAQPLEPRDLLARLGLQDSQKTPWRHLSGGQKQSLALGLAIIGRPELVFLDEPTAGLDPRARRATWEIIQALRQGGVTVLLTTHLLDEAERLADRIAIVHRGRLAAIGTLAELTSEGRPSLEVVTSTAVPPATLATLAGVESVAKASSHTYRLLVAATAPAMATVAAWANDAGVAVRSLRVREATLEEVYLRTTGVDGDA